MATFTNTLVKIGLNPSDFEVAIRVLENQTVWSWGTTERHRAEVLDVAQKDGIAFILLGWSVYDAYAISGGIGYGWQLDSIDSSGKREHLRRGQWRYQYNPNMDDKSLDYSKILEVTRKESGKWDVRLG